jgi:hypothetical protein
MFSREEPMKETLKREHVFGHELMVGDMIEGLVPESLDKIWKLTPYDGPLEYLFKEGAKIALFADDRPPMIIDNGALFTRVIEG